MRMLPNVTIFHLLALGLVFDITGQSAHVMANSINVGVRIGSMRLVRYKHVGIGNVRWVRVLLEYRLQS